jgi:hypothetical protein
MFYKIRLVNIPHSSVEDRLYEDICDAIVDAEKTGFETAVEGFLNLGGGATLYGSYSPISGWRA